ncbi:MAG TPA: Tad domain-containing protein [Anaerolineales bacterium]|nr:Tad domain-containing protein [Anaerolineales bacterium]
MTKPSLRTSGPSLFGCAPRSMPERRQGGQSLVIFALLLVALAGIAGLALDGGNVLMIRRQGQNAADQASLAGAFIMSRFNLGEQPIHELCSMANAALTAKAREQAGEYGYQNDTHDDWVTVSCPPTQGTYTGQPAYVEVSVRAQIPTALIHLVYDGSAEFTVRAVARGLPLRNIAQGYAIFGADPDDCDTIWFHGNADTFVVDGNIFSNSTANNPPSCSSGRLSGTGNVTLSVGRNFELAGNYRESGSGMLNGGVLENQNQQTLPAVPTPDCSGMPDYGIYKLNAGHTDSIPPGRYRSITSMAGANLTFQPGLYCIYGATGLQANGGTLTGDGVTFYLTNGPVEIQGNPLVTLDAPTAGDWSGMLFYLAASNPSNLTLTGTADTIFTGTIFAPNAPISLSGDTGTVGFHTQVIGRTVEVGGNATLSVQYDRDDNFLLRPVVELVE